MGFTTAQLNHLKSKLEPKHIKTRRTAAATLYYLEGWYAVAEANRIFGFDGWDRETLATNCVSTGKNRGDHAVAYTAKVRITVRAGKTTVVREGCGTGEARAFTPGQAHDLALKSAETDATKRALASFGNCFGLALYDPEQSGVRGRGVKGTSGKLQVGPWMIKSASGEDLVECKTPIEFGHALQRRMEKAENIDDLFGLWQQNVTTVRELHRLYRGHFSQSGLDGIALVAHLKACARSFAEPAKTERGMNPDGANAEPKDEALPSSNLPAKIDKNVLTLSEPKRIRSKEHLAFVARQPCLICGRSPSHAHHVRYAQPRGVALKVSDEFTVPLCAIHHSHNHATGNEKHWWREHRIDPLAIARQLWAQRNAPEAMVGGHTSETPPS